MGPGAVEANLGRAEGTASLVANMGSYADSRIMLIHGTISTCRQAVRQQSEQLMRSEGLLMTLRQMIWLCSTAAGERTKL